MESPRLHKAYEEWLEEATIDLIQEKMASGELTSKDHSPELLIVNQL
ncbi:MULTISPECIES: hypothetical protein [Robertmurraya]|uniref:Uncharacterized protein n=1 Tax=Robertmurraya beringensis TaxID=641660 RepID=A0ABV6KWI3_9BACI